MSSKRSVNTPSRTTVTSTLAMANPDIALPFNFSDYLELVDWSGRAIVHAKRGAISNDLPPILKRLGIQPPGFVKYVRRQENGFHHVIGTVE